MIIAVVNRRKKNQNGCNQEILGGCQMEIENEEIKSEF
jgi:hypothetical protein